MKNTLRVDLLSDDDLLSRTFELVGRGRRVDAALVAHIAEVDGRRLYLREACSSMFAYVTERLHLSESEAYLRIHVARTSRRFPQVLSMLADGRLHLNAIERIAPHLTVENSDELLARVAHRSKRKIELLLAELAPKADVPALVRRMPDAPQPAPSDEVRPDGVMSTTMAAARPSAVLVPLAPARFKVQFTASANLEAKIARVKALLRHQIPTGDLSSIVERAIDLLLAELERSKCAATDRPRKSVSQTNTASSSRHIPAPVRREVWQRDGGRCTFVDAHGQRCSANERLEFHHVVPFARGGKHTIENLRLLCSAHNGYQAEIDYGRDRIAEKKSRRGRPAPPPG